MTTAFQQSAFQDDAFQIDGAQAEAPAPPYKGGRGDNGDAPRRKVPFKPTGLPPRSTLKLKKAKDAGVDRRLQESAEIAAEVAGSLARELEGERRATTPPITELTLQEVDREIGRLLRKRLRTEEDELLLLILMAAAAVN